MSAARDVLAPILLAAVLVIVVHPIRRPLDRRGLPRWVGTGAVTAMSIGILVGLGVIVALAFGQFANVLKDYASDIAEGSAAVHSFFAGLGFGSPASIAGWFDPKTLLTLIFDAGSHLVSAGAAIFFVFGYVIFMAMDGSRFQDVPAALAESESFRMRTFREFAAGTSRYFAVNSIFGLIVAVIDGLALWALGIPAPFAWAVLAFVTNYIPNVGFVIGLIPPFILALVTGGWGLALLVLAIYCVVNVVLQVLVQPRFVSQTVQLSVTITFASVVVWTFLLGPIGSILAVPLTLLTRFLLFGADPDARLARWLSGEPEPPTTSSPPDELRTLE
ncbi:AI-2E family transporter [Leifsonia poae]|uniref:AI-2E family transporter n=1 Tax=Leifsonia poae TaxID=110933 RepID=UPI003D67E6A1